jgi:chaperonin GroEL
MTKQNNQFLPKEIIFHDAVSDKLLKGAEIVAKAVGSTMGPSGKRVIFGDNPNRLWPWVTKDGVTVAREIILKDSYEKIGADLLIQAANYQLYQTGDGTTLTTILAHEIYKEGIKYINADVNRTELIEGIDLGIRCVLDYLKSQKVDCSDKHITNIAKIACNNDEGLGIIISEAIKKVGTYGIVDKELSDDLDHSVRYIHGLHWDGGINNLAFINQTNKSLQLSNPIILLTDNCFSRGDEITPIIRLVHENCENSRPLVFICPKIQDEALAVLTKSCEDFKQGNKEFLFMPWLMPEGMMGTFKQKNVMRDIAAFTGAKYIESELGMRPQDVTFEMLGRCNTLKSYGDKTILKDGFGDSTKRIKYLGSELKNTSDKYDKDEYVKSLSRLNANYAVIRVGGANESEKQEILERVDDALRATKCAIEEGIVSGGGVALILCKKIAIEKQIGKLSHGEEIIWKAIERPLKTILTNANRNPDYLIEKILNGESSGYDLNDTALLNGKKDMIDIGVVDPIKVVRTALLNAVSVAKLMLHTDTLIVNKD